MTDISSHNVDKICLDDREIYLVGTAHVSAQSVDLVESVISQVSPDAVAVELCEGRLRSMKDPDRWKNTNIATVVREGRAHVLLAQLLLAAYQRKLGLKLKIKPGAEMMAAVNSAERLNVPFSLADREISVTLRRAMASLGIIGLFKVLYAGLVGMMQKPQEVTEEEIERLKSTDALEEVLREFGALLPDLRRALIDERDIYLAQKIREVGGKRIVAVVGAAHVPGIKKHIGTPSDLAPISVVPPKSLTLRIIGWSIPGLIVAGLVYGLATSGAETFTRMLTTWFWITGVAGALGAAVVRAHPLTVIASFVAAPIAALHPLLATGWVSGLVEAIVRKPRVCDLETIMDDMSSMRGMLSNRVSRTLLIVASTNLFVMVGMIFGAKQMLSIASEKAPSNVSAPAQSPAPSETPR
jgi:pheromone shutdown-related protein TraB